MKILHVILGCCYIAAAQRSSDKSGRHANFTADCCWRNVQRILRYNERALVNHRRFFFLLQSRENMRQLIQNLQVFHWRTGCFVHFALQGMDIGFLTVTRLLISLNLAGGGWKKAFSSQPGPLSEWAPKIQFRGQCQLINKVTNARKTWLRAFKKANKVAVDCEQATRMETQLRTRRDYNQAATICKKKSDKDNKRHKVRGERLLCDSQVPECFEMFHGIVWLAVCQLPATFLVYRPSTEQKVDLGLAMRAQQRICYLACIGNKSLLHGLVGSVVILLTEKKKKIFYLQNEKI